MVLVLDGKTDLNQISLTGVRAITLIGLLAIAPRSLEEIREAFLKLKIMDESQSDDILRIDLNTIKSFGCEVSRSSVKTGYKYVLTKHPFTIPIDMEDVKMLKRLAKQIKYKIDISRLIEFNNLLKKISTNIYDDEIKEAFLGISPLKHYDTDLLNKFVYYCENQNTVVLNYKKPTGNGIYKKEVIAQKLALENDKVYLYVYDVEKQRSEFLLFNRIQSVITSYPAESKKEQKTIHVKFSLGKSETDFINEQEVITEYDADKCLVEGTYFNEFAAIQRLLSFGKNCTIMEPADIKNKVICKLKEMRKIYEEKK